MSLSNNHSSHLHSRAQKNGLWSNLKAIWDNLFSLPPGIKTVCMVQFFASRVFPSVPFLHLS